MADYYLDTSTIVKQYAIEPGTVWVRGLVHPMSGNTLYTVMLTGPELVAALFRKVRNGDMSLADARQAAGNFQTNWLIQFAVMAVDMMLMGQAMRLVEPHGLRGFDAVHLAAVLGLHIDRQTQQLPPITFVSADMGQLRAATALGLRTENPNNH